MLGVRRQTRLRSLAVVLAAHGAAIWLVLTFAHTSFIRERERIVDVFDVRPVEPPPPLPPPPIPTAAAPRPQGRSAPAATASPPTDKAVPRPVTPTIVTAPTAPPAPPSGGPQTQIDGTGGGGTGGGGSGQGAAGSGGGGGLRPAIPVRLSGGRIVPRDYPRAAGGAQGIVVAHVAVGVDGRVTGCDVSRSSGNGVLDATTCRLIRERFRFTPARNAQGEAVPGEFGWQQRWWRD